MALRMRENKLTIFSIGVLSAYMIWRWRRKLSIVQKWTKVIPLNRPLLSCITVINDSNHADKVSKTISSHLSTVPFMGLDCEWVRSGAFWLNLVRICWILNIKKCAQSLFTRFFTKTPRNRDGPVALLQLATFDGESTKCFLFRLCKFNINESEELVKLLHSDEHVNLGVGIVGDIKRLRKDYSLGLEYSRNLDLRYLTKA